MGDETVLLDVESGVYFGLDVVGTEIWKIIERGARETEIIDCLLAQFEVDPIELRKDVSDFVDLLIEKGLARELVS